MRDTFRSLRSIEDLLRHFKVTVAQVDFLLIGDGSGTTWDKSIGFASTLVEMSSFDRTVFHGGLSHGTNNIAEIMAYFLPLQYLAKTAGDRRRTVIHIFSDSQYIVEGFNGESRQEQGNRELWQAMLAVKRRGLVIRAHWVPRDSVALQQLADTLAGQMRLSHGPTGAAACVLEYVNVYELNPFME